MDKREETHLRAWQEDRRRMRRVDQHLNSAASASATDVIATIDELPHQAATQVPIVPASDPVRPRFVDPPRFVTVTDPVDRSIVFEPAAKQKTDWPARLADCFGTEPQAANALLARLRAHLSGRGIVGVHLLNDALALVHAYAPRNMIEAELVVSAVIASHEADRQLLGGEEGGHLPTILERTRLGQKFLHLKLQTIDRLARVRGLGSNQTIFVQHTTVNASTIVQGEEGGP